MDCLVRFAARDPGGANVLASFLRQWRRPVAAQVDVWALPRAAGVFKRESIACRQFPEDFLAADVESAWRDQPAGVLITGTSHYAPFEPLLWELARDHGCPALAVIDQWTNLARRFKQGMPDVIGTVDRWQVNELLSSGFGPERLLTVGHPWLSRLLQERRPGAASVHTGSTEQQALHVLFVSERVAGDVAEGSNEPFGFDEFDSFRTVFHAAEAATAAGRRVCLAVKFHPYEDPCVFRALASKLHPPAGLELTFVEPSAHAHTWVRWADLLVGVSSMLLIEALVLGKPVVSVQPGLIREDTFYPATLGFAPTVTAVEEAERMLAELMLSEQARLALIARHRPFVQAIPDDSVAPLAGWIASQVQAVRSIL